LITRSLSSLNSCRSEIRGPCLACDASERWKGSSENLTRHIAAAWLLRKARLGIVGQLNSLVRALSWRYGGSFSSRSNAKRAAEKAIADGTAPSVDYGIKPTDEGRFEIVWKSASGTSAASTTEQVEAELAEAATEPERAC
jgi:hypothetical protein